MTSFCVCKAKSLEEIASLIDEVLADFASANCKKAKMQSFLNVAVKYQFVDGIVYASVMMSSLLGSTIIN